MPLGILSLNEIQAQRRALRIYNQRKARYEESG
jgi:hypothetical protein